MVKFSKESLFESDKRRCKSASGRHFSTYDSVRYPKCVSMLSLSSGSKLYEKQEKIYEKINKKIIKEKRNEKREFLSGGVCITSHGVIHQMFSLGSVTLGEDVVSKLDDFTSLIGKLTEGLNKGIKVNIGFDVTTVVKAIVLPVACAVSCVMAARGERKFLAGLLAALPLLLIESKYVSKRVSEIVAYFSADAVIPQMVSQSTFTKVLEIVFLLFSFNMFDASTLKSKFTSFMKIGTMKTKSFAGMTDVALTCVSMLEDVVNFVRHDLLGYEKMTFIERGCDETIAWMKDIDHIVAEFEAGSLVINMQSFDRVSVLKTIGCRIMQEACGEELKGLKFSISHYMKKLGKIDAEFQKAAIFKSGLRRKPLTICLVGKSGIGKSAATIPLINSLMVRVLDKDSLQQYAQNNMDFIYSRTFETKFWDGYRGHQVCVFDDFLQAAESQSDPDGEAMNVIRASNLFPYKLHMAHLEDKGNSYFSSNVIVCTTNMFELRTSQIKEQEALQRRFDIYCEIYPKEAHSKPGHNSDLKQRRLAIPTDTPFSKDVYEFHVINGRERRVFDYAGFEDFMEERYHHVVGGSGNYISAVSDDLKDMIAKRLAREEPAFFDAVDADGLAVVPQSGIPRLWLTTKMVGHPVSYAALCRAKIVRSRCLKAFGYDLERKVKRHGSKYREMLLDCVDDDQNTVVNFYCNWYSWIKEEFKGQVFEYEMSRYVVLASGVIPQIDDAPLKRLYGEPTIKQVSRDSVRDTIAFLEMLEREANDPYSGYVSDVFSKQIDEMDEATLIALINVEPPQPKENKFIKAINELKERLTTNVNNAMENYPILKYSLMALPVISALLAAWFAYKKYDKEDHFVEQSSVEAISQSAEFGRIGKTRVVERTSRSFQPQMMQMSRTTRDEAESVISRNQYMMVADRHKLGLVTAVGGDTFVANHHYYEAFETYVKKGLATMIKFVPLLDYLDGKNNGQRIMLKNILMFKPRADDKDNDLWFFRVKGMRPHRDISNKFVSISTANEFFRYAVPITLFVPRADIEAMSRLAQRSTQKLSMSAFTDMDSDESMGSVCYSDYLMYGAKTEAGDCGSLILVNDEMVQGGRVFGIHASLSKDGGYCVGVVVTKERIESALKELQSFGVVPQNCDIDNTKTFEGFPIVKIVSDPPHVARKTKLRQSPLHGCLDQPKKAPAVLQPVNGIDPYVKCLSKYGVDNRQVDDEWLNACSYDYYVQLHALSHGFSRDILTFEEACVGIDGEPYLNAIPRNTSAGYPWCNAGNSKWEYFGREEAYTLTTSACDGLRSKVLSDVKLMKDGKRPLYMFMDCMKDELRTHEKVKNMKTRMINACPLDLTVLIKMYFGRFSDFMMKTRIHNGIAVGINAVSREWNHLAKMIGRAGSDVIAGDFGSFDATQYSMILIEVCNIINRWYDDSEENQLVRRILWHEVWNSVHLHGKYAVIFDHCLSTGNPLTVIINSIYVQLVMRMVWISCHNDKISSLAIFRDNCSLVSYGDDHMAGISKDSIQFFNYHTIMAAMSFIGMEYTDEDKSSNPPLCKRIEECSFLKRGFIKNAENGLFEGPLSWETIREMPCWYRQGPNVGDRIVTNCVNSLREASLHPKVCFDIHLEQIQEHLKPLVLPATSQQYYREALSMSWVDEEEENAMSGKLNRVTDIGDFPHQ